MVDAGRVDDAGCRPEPVAVEARRRLVERDVRSVTFQRFPIYDALTETYSSTWSGWTTSSNDLCPAQPVTAVTPDGQCVAVQSCLPAEFDSCRVLDGCCDAPLPRRAAIR